MDRDGTEVERERRFWFAEGLLLLVIVLCYANSLENGFHFDDFHTVLDNPAVRSLHNVPRFFTDATTFSVLPPNRTYRPLVSTSLALDYALGHGYAPFWFHLSTLLWFLLEVHLLARLYALLFVRIRPGEASRWVGLLAAAWYGLHPAMAETVNYVIQRGDLYCTLGCVAALYGYARWAELRRYGLYLLPLMAALLSKPPAAVFPLLLAGYVVFFEERRAGTSRWRQAAVAAAPSAGVTAVLLWLQSAMTPKSFLPSMISAADYRLTQPFVWLRYFGALWLPLHLNVDTDLQPFHSLTGEALAGVLFVAAVAVAIWLCSRRRTLYPIAFGLLWFVVTELPTSLYPLSEVENDHRMFFAFVGLVMAVVWAGWLGLEWIATRELGWRWLRPAALAATLVALCGYAYGVSARNAVWRDEETLWRDDALKSPGNGRGLMIYGLTKMSRGDYTEALDFFERALRLTPNYSTLEINLGVATGAMADLAVGKGDGPEAARRSAEAEAHFRRAVALSPTDDQTHAYFGRWLREHGRTGEAVAELKSAIALDPQRSFQHEQLIQTYAGMGDAVDARLAAVETLRVVPDDAVARQALVQGAETEPAAVASAKAAVAAFWINDSLAKYRGGQFAESIESARKALALDPKLAEAWSNIGAAQGSLAQWDAAVESEQQALKLNPQLQIAQNNLRWVAGEAAKARSGSSGVAPIASAAELLDDSVRLNKEGKLKESIAAARRALELDPTMAEAWNNIAADYEGMQRWDEAMSAAEKAIALKPEFQLAKNNLAWSIEQKGRKQEAGNRK